MTDEGCSHFCFTLRLEQRFLWTAGLSQCVMHTSTSMFTVLYLLNWSHRRKLPAPRADYTTLGCCTCLHILSKRIYNRQKQFSLCRCFNAFSQNASIGSFKGSIAVLITGLLNGTRVKFGVRHDTTEIKSGVSGQFQTTRNSNENHFIAHSNDWQQCANIVTRVRRI